MNRHPTIRFTGNRLLAAALAMHVQLSVAMAGLTYPALPTPQESVLVYDATFGNLVLHYPETSEFGFNTFQLLSASGLFLTDTAPMPDYFHEHRFNRFIPNQIAYIGFGAPQKRDIALYFILPPDLSGEFVANDLTFGYSCTADSCASFSGLKVVPEPGLSICGCAACWLYCLSIRRES